MTRKRWLLYGLVGGLLTATVLLVYIYQEYFGEDTNPNAESPSNPIINQRLNAVVRRTSITRTGNLPKLIVAYTDIDTKESARFDLDTHYQHSIHIGDTLTKDKGEKLLLVYQKAGNIETIPID